MSAWYWSRSFHKVVRRFLYFEATVWAVIPTLAAMLLVTVCACAPFQSVPGDVCNDPTQNYTADLAYECNHR
jgi:hypothetical protein